MRQNHQVAVGNMGYVLDSSELYIRVPQGWRKVQVSTYILVSLHNKCQKSLISLIRYVTVFLVGRADPSS